jgi:predicted ATPase
MGHLASVPHHSDQELALYDPERQRGRRTVAGDAVVDSLGHCAFALWALGYPDRARDKGMTAITLARRVTHPFGLCSAVNWNAYLHYFRREPALVAESIGVLSEVAREQGFAFWTIFADIGEIWHRICATGERNPEGIERFRKLHAGLRTLGAELAHAPYSAMLVDCLVAQGRIEEAVEALVEALADVARVGEAVLEPQLLCLLGDVLHRRDPATPEQAESSYRRAIDVAQRQSAKTWELRAATGLAGLWRGQGKRTEARELLAPIYGWFTEGFDTPDLTDAKALLDRLV